MLSLTEEQIEQLKKLWAMDNNGREWDREVCEPPPPPRCECGAAALGYKKPGKFHSASMPCPLYHE